MKKVLLLLIVVLLAVLMLSAFGMAKVEKPPDWSKNPFRKLWDAVLDLQEQINNIAATSVPSDQVCPEGEFVKGFDSNGDLICSPITVLVDADGDGHISTAFGGDDCDDSDSGVYPGALEVCDDGTDNDCDTVIDCQDADCAQDPSCDGVIIKPSPGDIVFNEVLTDGDTDEDANGDGDIDSRDDEFVEIINVSSASVDLSGCTLIEQNYPTPRHTFVANTVLPAGEVIVVFGGGTAPVDHPGAQYLAAVNGDIFGLDLEDLGDVITLYDADSNKIIEFAYGNQGPELAIFDESSVRDPEGKGGFVPHTTATGAEGRIFSPGHKVNGSNFP